MNSSSDSFAFQKVGHGVPFLGTGSNDIHVINMPGPDFFRRSPYHVSEPLVIPHGNFSPPFVQLVDVAQLDAANCRLNFVESKVITNEVVDIF